MLFDMFMRNSRDSLGRILFDGDIFTIDKESDTFTIALLDSPKHSNYARYFSDIGTIDEIESAYIFATDCFKTDCRECPFNYPWTGSLDCMDFGLWLRSYATI